jgi:hypothetical protein
MSRVMLILTSGTGKVGRAIVSLLAGGEARFRDESAADHEHAAERLDGVAGSEFIDDRLRLRE